MQNLIRLSIILVLGVLFSEAAQALPKYSFRSARICDNCHSTPFKTLVSEEWVNPELKKRKCNMSCQSCHINPAGGGLRNAAGRYYGVSTLPMFGAKWRPYHDKVRKPYRRLTDFGEDNYNTLKGGLKSRLGSLESELSETEKEKLRIFLAKLDNIDLNTTAWPGEASEYFFDKKLYEPKWYYPDDFMSYGSPIGAGSVKDQSVYAYDRTRYMGMNADPFVTAGFDVRPAYYQTGDSAFVFPMQVEVGTAVHPVEHLTLAGTAAGQGRTSGTEDSFNNPVKLQNAFVMVHELPYMAYVQAGYYLPEFGLRIEDHTSYTRRPFEMDPSEIENTVKGVQVGAAPNYPYASVGGFSTQDENADPTGAGFNANLGYRGITWGAGGSVMAKFRDFADGGDMKAASLSGYYNIWHLFPKTRYKFPILLQFEYALGEKERIENQHYLFHSYLFQVDYLVLNGLNLRTNVVFYDADLELKDTAIIRFAYGFDWIIYPGLRFTMEVRTPVVPGGSNQEGDVIMFMHGWY